MSKAPQKGKAPLASRTRTRLFLEEAYQVGLRPLIVASYLENLRKGQPQGHEREKLKEIVKLALILQLPLPKAFHGDPVALKRLSLAKAEASLSNTAPLLDAVRRRLGLPNPKEKSIPVWMIRSCPFPGPPKIQRARKTNQAPT